MQVYVLVHKKEGLMSEEEEWEEWGMREMKFDAEFSKFGWVAQLLALLHGKPSSFECSLLVF